VKSEMTASVVRMLDKKVDPDDDEELMI